MAPAAAPRPDAFLAVLGLDAPACRSLARALHAALKDEAIDRPEAAPVARAADAALADASAWAAALEEAHRAGRVLIGAPHAGLGWPPGDTPRDGFVLLLAATTDAPDAALALRARLLRSGLDHAVLHGAPAVMRGAALQAWRTRQAARRRAAADTTEPAEGGPRWRHACGRCGDGDCERALFADLQRARSGG